MQCDQILATIVVVNYRTDDDVVRLIGGLQLRVNRDLECIVVSNSHWKLDKVPDAEVIQMPVNVGYGRAINAAIGHATGRFVIVLNPDIVASPEDLRSLTTILSSNSEARVGIAAPKLLNADGSIQLSCRTDYAWYSPLFLRVFPTSRHATKHYMRGFDHCRPAYVDWVTGAAIAFSRELISAVGGFDGRFFLYVEDVDFCLRTRLAGYRVLYAPQVVLTHSYARGSLGLRWGLETWRLKTLHVVSFIKLLGKYRFLPTTRVKYSAQQENEANTGNGSRVAT